MRRCAGDRREARENRRCDSNPLRGRLLLGMGAFPRAASNASQAARLTTIDCMAFEFDVGATTYRIGEGRCFVIAEAGVNHNGDVGLAKDLVKAAASAGADAVKFQTWRTEKIVAAGAPMAAYQSTGPEEDQFALLKKLELGDDAFVEIAAYAAECGILFLSTPDDEDSADFLEELDVPLFKIGSAEVTNLPYLAHVGAKGRPVILSTGMATLAEVEHAVEALEETGVRDLALLHCVSSYPSEPRDSNLRAMATMRAAFGYPVGFSDHTLGSEVALAAVALGACVLEKHLTLNVDLEGPDHKASLEPEELARLVSAVRVVESALGDGRKRPTAAEAETKLVVRRRVLAGRHLTAGTQLAEVDLILRRAGAGAFAEELPALLGRRLVRDVAAGEPVASDDTR
jgi:N,N'-diacetyllegionaminate synthase